MALATIAVSYGSVPTAITFDDRTPSGDGVNTWYAPSPQGDLEGQWVVTLETKTTKANVELTRESVKIPIWDSTANEYDGFIEVDVVVKRPRKADTGLVSDALDIAALIAKYGTDAHNALVEGKPSMT